MKILVIEDQQELARDIVNYLSEEEYRCETANDFASAKEKVSLYQYDCILLDLMLPGGDGFEILEHLRSQNKQDGVIIISAKNTLENQRVEYRCGRLFGKAISPFRVGSQNSLGHTQEAIRSLKFDNTERNQN